MMTALDHPWLKHPKIWVTIGVLCLLFTVGSWLVNRDVPTEIGDQLYTPSVLAGDEVVIQVPIHRNMARSCSVDVSRELYNSNHERAVLIAHQHVTAEGREMRQKESAAFIAIRVRIPPSTPSGPATIISDNSYRCAWNPSTWLVPIDDSWEANITVLPPKAAP